MCLFPRLRWGRIGTTMEQEMRRLKRLFKDPNPLFTAWLTEWREEADRKDSKMKYVYGVALKSLRQYPLPLTSGKSCNILKGFGATLCARLDQRLQEHIEEHGPLPALGVADQVELERERPKAPAKKRTPKPAPVAAPKPSSAERDRDSPVGKVGKRGRPAGEYRPKPGSGGFALLVALRRQEKQQGYAGFLRKAALQEAAQPLCNASLTLPEAGGYYTAWSTMGTLVKRKLVRREGNPARFSLTDVGREVADRLDSSPWTLPSQRECFDRLTGMSPPSDCTGSSPVRGAPPVAASSSRPAEPRTVPQRLPSDTVAPSTDGLMYQYISSAGAAVRSKDDAQVSVDGGRVGFLVRCRRDALDASGRTYWTDPDRPERDGIVHVFLSDADCAEECPSGPLSGPSPPPPVAARQTKLHDMSDSDSDDGMMTASQSLSASTPRSQSQSQSQSLSQSQSQSQFQSQRQARPQVGTSLKRQSTDWRAALKRLRSDISADSGPSESVAASSRPTSSSGAASLSDEDCHLLSDDDDDVLITAADIPPRPSLERATISPSPTRSVGSPPLSGVRRTESAVSPVAKSADRLSPPPAAVLIRERAAAAAEARAKSRPPPAAAGSGASRPPAATGGSSEQRPTPSASVPRPVVVEDWRPAAPTFATERRPPEPAAELRDFTPSVVLRPGTFDVVLCVDNQETSGKSGPGACLRTYRDVVLAELQKNGVVADVRKLSVGDFLWVARPRTGKQPEELILPYIVERKRLDDLASSIRDSRYREQKFRLKRCGVPNVIYLAEAMGTGPRARSVGLPESTLQQALANCQVVDGFRVKWTADQRETAAFLTLMTRRLQQRYQYRQLEGCPREQLPAGPPSAGGPERLQLFSEFHQLSAKRQRLTARDMFAKMLLQLSGLSADKAAAIVAEYPTVARLLEAYAGCESQAEAEKLLAPLRADRSGRPVGAAISKAVYHLYSDRQLT
ncbi:crossover junction endonuclease MUS81-like isoform X2 [Amphibalanus amphitrite]|uniref:crossover junction endonuclease MUS81-like isoform X2 n=2 Tax=Amphibalanus amphitrite TaxID=1232801 RepID=UPI001C91B7D8|nr:crossover junction endonuclease MUS81-like isoform X2 [Amphibalanus amphitrite]